MDKEILKIVNKVLSEEVSGKLSKIKRRIFENKAMCSECGSSNMMEGECMECGSSSMMEEKMCSECGSSNMMEGECMECGKMYEGDIQELGGMDDGHPKFGHRRLPKRMSPEEIEKLLRGDDEEEDEITFDDEDLENTSRMKRRFRKNEGELEEKLYGKQSRLDKNKNGKIDKEDFAMLRRKGVEKEIDEKLYGKQSRLDKNKNGKIDREDFKLLRKEMYELTLDDSDEKFIFTENEIVDIIENIILEEKKKSKTKSKDPIKLTKANQEKSKKENDDHIDDVVKKMKDYLKDGSKGDYEMNPKHFPKGNGELEKMDKMAYIPSNAVQDYTDNFTAAALENLDFNDGIKPDEEWMDDLLMGSSRTGNNPDWANAVETPVNKKRNQIRKDNLLAKIKRQAYNKAPQPVNDVSGNKTDKASKIMLNLESTEDKKVISDIDKMKTLMGYSKNTQ